MAKLSVITLVVFLGLLAVGDGSSVTAATTPDAFNTNVYEVSFAQETGFAAFSLIAEEEDIRRAEYHIVPMRRTDWQARSESIDLLAASPIEITILSPSDGASFPIAEIGIDVQADFHFVFFPSIQFAELRVFIDGIEIEACFKKSSLFTSGSVTLDCNELVSVDPGMHTLEARGVIRKSPTGIPLSGPVTQASNFTAPIDISCNANELINAINRADIDTINLETDCIYRLSTEDNDTKLGSNGLPSITREITINGNGAIITRNSDKKFRIFHVSEEGNLTLNNLTISNGFFDQFGTTPLLVVGGGGIFNEGVVTLNNSTVSNNIAEGSTKVPEERICGGGIFNKGTLTLNNSTVSGNSTNGYTFLGSLTGCGGGIYNDGSSSDTVTLNNSTVSNNSANSNIGKGGSIFNSNFGTVKLINTIVAKQKSGGDCVGSIQSLGHNLDSDGSCINPLDDTDITTPNPYLASLRLNPPGKTATHALLPGSPAIDAGDDVTCAAAPVNNVDQRGVSRLVGAACDIGAYEAAIFVDVTIIRFIQIQDPDPAPSQGNGDYYARVHINDVIIDNFDDRMSGAVINPFWVFFVPVDPNLETIPVTIEIIDYDPDIIIPNPDDPMDISPIDGVTALNLTLDLNTGNWIDEIGRINPRSSKGDGDIDQVPVGGEKGEVFFDINVITAITLLSFTAQPATDHVTLVWQTGTEIDNAGFNLHRATSANGPYTRLNDALIPAEGNPVSGASYTYTDNNVVKGVTYYYKLEDVDIHGVSTFHGPVSAMAGAIGSVYLPIIVK